MKYPINARGIDELRASELFVGQAYPDPLSPMALALQAAGHWRGIIYRGNAIPSGFDHLDGAPWTIGYGFTKGVKRGDRMTLPQAEVRLAAELRTDYVEPMLALCTLAPNENQLAGMACLVWNIGIPAFRKSTVLAAHNRGDFAAASRAFGLLNKARGKVVDSLETRRRREAALYATPVEFADELPEAVPQRVDPETSMARSPIIAGSTVTAGVSVLGVASEVSGQVKTIKENLGDWLPWVLLAVALAGAGWAIWTRLQQRKGGWA